MTATPIDLYEPRQVQATQERTAAYRLRYDAFIGEQHKTQYAGLVDDERRELYSPADTDPCSELYVCGPSEHPSATVTLRIWQPGQMPADDARYYSLDQLPGIQKRTVAEISKLTIRRDARGGRLTTSMLTRVIERAIVAHEADLIVMCCMEWLVPIYLRFGLRPFGAEPVSTPDGSMPVLMYVVPSLAPLRESRSPFLPLVERLHREGAFRSRADLSDYTARLEPWTGVKVARPYARSA
jgi:predicted GNAT family N-acyltransferase